MGLFRRKKGEVTEAASEQSRRNQRRGARSVAPRGSESKKSPKARARGKRGKTNAAQESPPKAPRRNQRTAAKQPIEPPQPVARRGLKERAAAVRGASSRAWQRVRGPLFLTGKMLLVAAAVAGAVALGRLVDTHVRTSPAFATIAITVDGLERLEPEDVEGAAGLSLGQNVFEVAPEQAQAALERHPWVSSATVRRRLPGTFEVELREHRAVAILALDGLFLIGEDGTVFKELTDEDPVDLPVVTGVEKDRFTGDRAYRTSLLLEVVALMHDYRGAGLWRREPIAEIHIENDDGLSLYVGVDAGYVRLGRGPYRQKLRKLRQVLDRLDEREARAAYVYLDNVRRPDRVTVRLR